MSINAVVQYLKEKKQDAICDDNLLNFNLKALCFAGLFPYEKICNTPRKLKLYHAYQITSYVLYCPILSFLSLSPTSLQPGVGLGLPQEFPPSFPV
jgi:hypothetical protein